MGEGNAKEVKQKSLLRRLLVGFGKMIVLFILLIFAILLLIQTKGVQNYARKEIVAYLGKKLETKVVIRDLRITFPSMIVLEGIYVEDQTKDTLVAGQSLAIDMNFFRLLQSELVICDVNASGLVVNINRRMPDTVFNYQFILDAFSSKTPSVTEKVPMKMTVEHLMLDATYFTFIDEITGNEAEISVAHFDTYIDRFEPTSLNFDVPTIKIDGIKGHVCQSSPQEIIIATNNNVQGSYKPETVFLNVTNQQTSIHKFEFEYSNEISGIQTSFKGHSLEIFPKILDIGSNLLAFRKIETEDLSANVIIQNKNTSDLIKLTSSDGQNLMTEYLPWKVTADVIRLQNSQLIFDDNTKPALSTGMDYGHLALRQLHLEADHFLINKDTIAALITSGSLTDKSGFVLNSLYTDFQFTDKGIRAAKLLMKTPGSEIKRSVVVRYPSMNAIVNDKRLIVLDLEMENSVIKVKDILYFVPLLAGKPGFMDPESTFDIHGSLSGSLEKLSFPSMKIKGFGNTKVDFSGTLANVTDLDQLGLDLDIRSASTTVDDIRTLLPKSSIPENITIPEKLSLNGMLNGNMTHLLFDLKLNTTLGNATAKGTVRDIKKSSAATYDGFVSLNGIQLGKLMQQQENLGAITAQLTMNGKSFDQETAKAKIGGLISSFDYQGYVYENINLDVKVDRMTFIVNGGIKDPNIHLTFEGEGDLLAEKPCIILYASIDSIKTWPLHLTVKPLVYKGQISSYIPAFDPDTLAGYVFVTKSLLIANDKRIELDSVSMIATFEKNIQSVSISSDFMQATIAGKYKATQFGDIFMNAMLPYYTIQPDTITHITNDYDFNINGAITDHPAIRAFLPRLNRLGHITMSGDFSSEHGWTADIKVPYLTYGTSLVSDLNIFARTKDDALNVAIDVGNMSSGENITMTNTRLIADIANQKIEFALRIGGKGKEDKYIIHGGFENSQDSLYSLTIRPDSLILNYQPWEIDKENSIRFNPSMVQISHFDLSKDDQHLLINNKETGSNSPIEILFKDFELSTLTGFIQADSLLADGILGGTILLRDVTSQPNFTTDLSIKNLSVNKDTIGDVRAVIDNTQPKVFDTNIMLTGRGNDVTLAGNYYLETNGKSTMDLILDIKTLQMRSLEGLSMGNIRKSEGHLSGKVNIEGQMDSPKINGQFGFFKTTMELSKLNSIFKVDNGQVLSIDNEGIRFNDFTIKDAGGNRFVINGNVFTKNYINYIFDLNLKANDFQALNSTRADNQAYYGKIVFDTDIQLAGTEKAPVIDGKLKINEGTEFTIVLPQNEPGLVARDGVVIFVDKDAPVDDELLYSALDSLNQTSILGMYVSVNIEIDKKATLNIVIDESNNDLLKLKGQALLNGGIDRSGKVTLTGTYELDEGAYEMSFNLIERRFVIQKGSKITWTGEPTDGNLSITAVYKVNTSVAELVQDQIAEAKTDLRYRQKLPFEVQLSMSGPLLQPVLAFEIKLPEESLATVGGEIGGQVEMRLQQLNAEPSELNKQVFSLLILNRFTSQNPFESAGGGINAASMARQSVSKILTSQLNKLAEDLISGVDVNFDIISSEDYTTGTMQNKTDLSVGVSKRLFSERLNVTLGTNIALEGGSQSNSSGSLSASNAPNINIEYLLSKDGRYLLKAYRRNKYEGILEGYIVETGIGFVMSVDYDSFKEIFERRKSNNKFEKASKASEIPKQQPESPPVNKQDTEQNQGIHQEIKEDDEN